MFYGDAHIGRSVMRRVKVVEVDDADGIQKVTVQGLKGEYFKMPYRGQPHGMSSVPEVGMVGYVFMASGRPDQAFLMGLEDPELRPKDKVGGETRIYGKHENLAEFDDNGNILLHSPNGIIHLNPP
jgi:phage gp45-like